MAERAASARRPWLEGARVELDAARLRAILRCAEPARGRASARLHGALQAPLARAGYDLIGHRAWRDGDDPRALDAAASARAGRWMVRETRGEAARRVVCVLDARAAMGVGAPGKLQRAAELALVLAARTLRARGEFVCVAATREQPWRRELCDWRAWHALASALAELEAGDADACVTSALEHACTRAQRVVLVSDFFELEVARARALARRGRELDWWRVRADAEALRGAFDVAHVRGASIEWRAPLDGRARATDVDAAALAHVRARLVEHDDAWRRAARELGARWIELCASEPLAESAHRCAG